MTEADDTVPRSVRIPRWLDRELADVFGGHGLGSSQRIRAALEEWSAMTMCRGIEFRDGVGGRRAAIVDGPEIWEVIRLTSDAEREADGFHISAVRRRWPEMDLEKIKDAYAFYARFGEHVRSFLALAELSEAFADPSPGEDSWHEPSVASSDDGIADPRWRYSRRRTSPRVSRIRVRRSEGTGNGNEAESDRPPPRAP